MNILKLRNLLDNREISSVELVKSCLDRISASDSIIGAFLHINSKAIKAAEQAQKRIDAKESGVLTGIPIGVKDNICTNDMPTTCASRMLEGFIPPYDADVVERLRAQDAVLIGKLNTDEFAIGGNSATSYYKKTRNPFNIDYVPGGSSGGSAAAVAAGFCPVALGTDTGGSIRQPASFCGITGLRPTYGTVSRYGCVPMASSMDQVGPMAVSAEDCALLLSVIAGVDPRDQMSVESPSKRTSVEPISLQGKRLGLIEGDFDGETMDAIKSAASWYEKQGAIIETVSLPLLEYTVPAYFIISCAETSANLSRFDGLRYGYRSENADSYEDLVSNTRREGFGREVKRRIMLGNHVLCAENYDNYYKKAVRLAGFLRQEFETIFETYDALLSPVNSTTAYSYEDIPTDPAMKYLSTMYTAGAALTGLPSLSTPCGYTSDGLPIGLMITGAHWDDYGILSLANTFEQSFERKQPPEFEVTP